MRPARTAISRDTTVSTSRSASVRFFFVATNTQYLSHVDSTAASSIASTRSRISSVFRNSVWS